MSLAQKDLTELCRRVFAPGRALRVTRITPLAPSPLAADLPPPPLAPPSPRAVALVVEPARGQGEPRELVLRLHGGRETRWVLEDPDRAEREYALLRGLEARGFPVPRAYGWGREGGGWVLMDRVCGRPAGTGARARREALGWLNRLHSLASETVLPAPLPHVTLVGVIARARAWGEEAGEAAVCAAATELARRAAVPESPRHLLHGDPRPHRFRVARGRVVGWLHWADGAVGDPRWDLAVVALDATPGTPDADALSLWAGPEQVATLRLYAAALALRDWSAAVWRAARNQDTGEHSRVLARAPVIEALRQRYLIAAAALEDAAG